MKWTLLASSREPSDGVATGSTYTAPVNHSLGPVMVSMELLVICIGSCFSFLSVDASQRSRVRLPFG